MKILRYIVCACLSFAVLGVNAQDRMTEEYFKLQDQLKEANAEIEALKKEKESLKGEYDSALKKAVADSVKAKDKEIADLKKEVEKAKGEIEKAKSGSDAAVDKAVKDSVKVKDKEIAQLKKDIDKITKERDKAIIERDDFKNKKAQSDSLLKLERDSGDKKALSDQIKGMEKDKAALETAKNTEIATLNEKINQMSETIKLKDGQIAQLETELNTLGDFKAKYMAGMVESIDKKWMGLSYSQINLPELKAQLDEFNKYASADPRIADGAKKLQKLYDEAVVYDNGIVAISSPYDDATVTKALADVNALAKTTTDKKKKEELDDLATKLDNYNPIVGIFQYVIQAIDEQVAGRKHSAALPLVKIRLSKLDEEDDFIKPLQDIPWTKEQYEIYYNALMKDCTASNLAREAVMNIKL